MASSGAIDLSQEETQTHDTNNTTLNEIEQIQNIADSPIDVSVPVIITRLSLGAFAYGHSTTSFRIVGTAFHFAMPSGSPLADRAFKFPIACVSALFINRLVAPYSLAFFFRSPHAYRQTTRKNPLFPVFECNLKRAFDASRLAHANEKCALFAYFVGWSSDRFESLVRALAAKPAVRPAIDFLHTAQLVDCITRLDSGQQPEHRLAARAPYALLGHCVIEYTDLLCLQPLEYLNDSIIDFTLNHYLAAQSDNSDVFLFNSFFYNKWQSFGGLSDKAFDSVKKWTKCVDVFDKDFLAIPINESCHWTLAIVAFPAHAAGRVPCVYWFNSLGGPAPSSVHDMIKQYLTRAWAHQRPNSNSPPFASLPIVSLSLPLQSNSSDCGLFVVHYFDLFLVERPRFRDSATLIANPHALANWFVSREAARKRETIRSIIQDNHKCLLASANSLSALKKRPRAVELVVDE